MGCYCLSLDRVNLAENNKKETKGRVKMDLCYLSPDRVKLTVNSKKGTHNRVKMGKESKWSKGQDGLLLFTLWKSQNGTKVIMSCCCLPPERVKLIVNSRVKMGWCCLPPDWVKLTVNSKKETNCRVKMGKESKWANSQDGLLLFTPWKSQN